MNFILPVKNGWEALEMSSLTSGYSFPSVHLIVSLVRTLEWVRNEKFAAGSMNKTGRYLGWISFFMTYLCANGFPEQEYILGMWGGNARLSQRASQVSLPRKLGEVIQNSPRLRGRLAIGCPTGSVALQQ